MARQTYSNLIALLKAKLEGLQDGDSNDFFHEVIDYPGANFSGYPSAAVYEVAGEGEVIDTHRNERSFNFEIKLYQEQSEEAKNNSAAATVMRESVDKVIEAFDTDKDLSGNVQKVEVVPVDFNFSGEAGTFSYATFSVNLIDLVNNY